MKVFNLKEVRLFPRDPIGAKPEASQERAQERYVGYYAFL